MRSRRRQVRLMDKTHFSMAQRPSQNFSHSVFTGYDSRAKNRNGAYDATAVAESGSWSGGDRSFLSKP